MKTCPQCAEQIQSAAKVCRFCGHPFSTDQVAAAQRDEDRANLGANLTKALPLILVIVFIAVCSKYSNDDKPAAETVAAVDPAPCDKLIEDAQREGLVKSRPDTNRVDVEDRLWAEFPAGAKRGLVLAVRCSAFRGAAADGDYAVVYGYRSGKRLAMATSVGVSFD